MNVRENLIAAKAIVEEEKIHRLNPLHAVRDAVSGEEPRILAYMALRGSLPNGHKYVMQWIKDAKPSRADVIALFDRAIAAQGDA